MTTRPDRALATHVLGALEHSPDLDASDIRITVRHGVVQARGSVRTHSERLLARSLISAVPGVEVLDSLLEVQAPQMRWDLDDAAIRSLVLAAVPAAVRPDVNATVRQHVVTLTGTVPTTEDVEQVRHAVAPVPGVDFIVNQLQSTTARGVELISEDECWRLLDTRDLGRLAVHSEVGIDIFPVNYLAANQTVYFRSGPGTKMVSLTTDPQVAFEVDGGRGRTRWSVVIRGQARRLDRDDEIAASGVLELQPFDPRDKFDYVAISPGAISGRRFARQ